MSNVGWLQDLTDRVPNNELLHRIDFHTEEALTLAALQTQLNAYLQSITDDPDIIGHSVQEVNYQVDLLMGNRESYSALLTMSFYTRVP